MPPYTPVLLSLLAAATISSAQAAERTAMLSGTTLTIDSPCAVHVGVVPDIGLHGQVAITATADHQGELDRLVTDSARSVRIKTGPLGCWQPVGDFSFQRTLQLAVRVPPGMPITISESGAGSYAVGDVGGPSTLRISGAARVSSGRVTDFSADLSGSASIHVTRIDGSVTASMSGHGDITVDTATIAHLAVDMSGDGTLAIGSGRIGRAVLSESGVGSIRLGGEIVDASVDLSGVGSVTIGKVTGRLQKEVSGMGSVTVGN